MKKSRYRLIMGKNCIQELLRAAPDRLVEVYTSIDKQDAFCGKLREQKIPVKTVSKKELTDLVKSDSHQSFVAAVKERFQQDLKNFLEQSLEKKSSLVVVLDSIFDPHNLGAILRSSECFGVDLVIFSKNRGTDVTPVVSKTSVGASELVPILKVSNLSETIKQFQKNDYWVVSAEGGEKADSIYSFKFPEKTLLILGSEGKGVQKILSKNADFHVQIPMLGQIDSLNVSQAAAVFLSSFRKEH